MSVVLIDNYDSFVYIIEQYLAELDEDRTVLRSDAGNIDRIEELAPDYLVLGPGPGHPVDSGHVELVHHFAGRIPILGVCLGLQAVGVAYGATVSPAAHIMHGKTSTIEHDGKGVFSREQGTRREVTRYHSLIIEEPTLPAALEVTSRSLDDGYIMGVRHRELPVEAIQFHPESVGTERGIELLRGFHETYVRPA
ncbi:aminodeoxychorismate/anthranilate synthase component II [Brachybacterium huguangmaarense]|uniref:Aminodeoxychorismate/anthranilate synthase component II n=1 Tax=Brachybacterium huguangmaarense TaxID=1652028 RepID=A0ABY6G3F5_9MICO|nr:aminodeoxychorismate/anthranilate synthase component II [Brachybacterium huguangmaarense]UYG17625.1 aminodeoxychorismate/anthranilate synthase component II [Brachybacterium huguangmaarense]